MYPYLRTFVEITPIDEGVLFQGNNEVVIIKGKSLYKWFMKLKPLLNGAIPLEDIYDLMNEKQQKILEMLLKTLMEYSFIIDYSKVKPHSLKESELLKYKEEIGYLENFTSSPEHNFQLFRESDILVISPLSFIPFIVRSLVKSGAKNVDFMSVDTLSNNNYYRQTLDKYKNEFPTEVQITEIESKKRIKKQYNVVLLLIDLQEKNDYLKEYINLPHLIPCFIVKNNIAYIGPIDKTKEINYSPLIKQLTKLEEGNPTENSLYNNIFVSNSLAYEALRYLTNIFDYSDTNTVEIKFNSLEQKEILINNYHFTPFKIKRIEKNDIEKIDLESAYDRETSDILNEFEKKLVNTKFSPIDVNRTNSQIPISNCVLTLKTDKVYSEIRKYSINYKGAFLKGIDEALKKYLISEITDFKYNGYYFSLKDNEWRYTDRDLNIENFILLGSSNFAGIVEKGNNLIKKNELLFRYSNSEYLNPIRKDNLDNDSVYYYELLETSIENVELYLIEEEGYYVSIIQDLDKQSNIITGIGLERKEVIIDSLISGIEKIWNRNGKYESSLSKELVFNNSSDNNLIVIPMHIDLFKINYTYGWIGHLSTRKEVIL